MAQSVPITISIGETVLDAHLWDNPTAADLADLLPLTLRFSDFGAWRRRPDSDGRSRWTACRAGRTPSPTTSATTSPTTSWSSTTATSASGRASCASARSPTQPASSTPSSSRSRRRDPPRMTPRRHGERAGRRPTGIAVIGTGMVTRALAGWLIP